MENIIGAPQKTKNRTAIGSSSTTLGRNLKECKSGYNKDTSIPIFIAALLNNS
jgi:hypothetical protein